MLRTHENRYAEQLDMVYKGNRLTKVSKNGDPNLEYDFQGYPDKANASTEMTYDPNGNMTADLDRGIVAIRYNLLNLPDTVQFENGNRIVYFYYAGGERAGAVTTTYSTPISVPLDSVYLGEDPHFDMWEHRHGNLFYKMGSPSRLLFDDGFFELAERHGGLISQIPYVFVRDHIGSVRLVCNVNTGEVVQSLRVPPFGGYFPQPEFRPAALPVYREGAAIRSRARLVRFRSSHAGVPYPALHHDGSALREILLHLALCLL